MNKSFEFLKWKISHQKTCKYNTIVQSKKNLSIYFFLLARPLNSKARIYKENIESQFLLTVFQFMRLRWLLLYVNLAKFQDFSNRQGNFLWYFTPLLLVQWCELPKRMYSLSDNADQQVGLCHSSIRTWRYFTSDLLWNIFLCNKEKKRFFKQFATGYSIVKLFPHISKRVHYT